MAGLVVDMASVRRSWWRTDGEAYFALDLGAAEQQFTGEELRARSAAVRAQLSRERPLNLADALGWVRTDKGWSGILVDVDQNENLEEWFDRFSTMSDHELVGTVRGQPRSGGAWGTRGAAQRSAYVAYTTGDLTAIDSDFRNPLWHVDKETTRKLADSVVDWTSAGGGQQYLGRRNGIHVRPTGGGYGPALAEGIDRYVSTSVECVRKRRPFHGRAARWWPHGEAVYTVIDPEIGWADQVAALRETLLWDPSATDLALVRQDPYAAISWMNLTPAYVSEPMVRYNRPLLTSFTPDAAGLQLVTSAHLERAHDLSGWITTAVGANRYLLQARDLGAWLAEPEVDSELLAAGRADFGDMILTMRSVVDNNPWRDGSFDLDGRWQFHEPRVALDIPEQSKLM